MGFRIAPVDPRQVQSGTFGGAYTLAGAMQSPNYVHGSSGWAIKGDGSVEFNNGLFRGQLSANSMSNTSIGSSTFQGGTVAQSTITEPVIVMDSGGGDLLVYATTSVVTTYSTNGSFVVPAGITSLKAECIGGGAGGYNGAIVGPGGGGGEYAAETALTVTPGETLTVTVGAGGSAGTLSQTVPGTGGTTTLKRSSTALVTANGGGTSSSGAAPGGSGSTNSTHFNGGSSPFPSGGGGLNIGGTGGGGSGGSSTAGNNGSANSGSTAGAGGAAVSGGGAGGNGGSGAGTQGTAGAAGGAPGGGGGSGGIGSNGNGNDGGAGAAGQVKITYVQSQTLIGSVSPAAGSDSNSNQYPQGFMGSMVAVQPSSTPQVPEVWHNLPFAAQWGNAPTPQPPQYRVNPDGTISLRGRARFTANGSTGLDPANGTLLCTMPTAYRPANLQGWPVPVYGSPTLASNRIPSLVVGSDGRILIYNVSSPTTNGTTVDVDITGTYMP